MVDPNPARGMPAQLKRYWLAGKGAAKIRWGMPHDFTRCVRQLRKYFPKNPEGLCNKLHQQRLGAPPGKGHAHSITMREDHFPDALTAAAQALIDRQPKLGKWLWAGPLAPVGRPTGEPKRTRIFEPGALNHRMLPLPLDWRERTGQGHDGAVTVGRILGIAYGPDHEGNEFAWGWGDYLDDDIIPEAKRARYLAEMGVAGPSVDPGGKVMAAVNPETGFEHYTLFGIGGSTLVSIPAFAELRQTVFDADGDWPDDDPDMVEDTTLGASSDCGCGGVAITASQDATFTVNTTGWRGLPLAARESTFDNDDAVKRIQAWATVEGQPDVGKLRRAFMWRDEQLPETNTTGYRLPVGDIINGRLTLVYHAIYAAAALLSGAHGGLPQVPEEARGELRNTISEIYDLMATEFNDPSVRAPWDRSAQQGVQLAMTEFSLSDEGYPLTPPKSWFEDPQLTGRTKLTVTDEGRVFGHLAAWGECHRDVTMRECVLAPKSQQGYAPFHLGTVVTAEGETLAVGKIVQDTRHAHIGLGYTSAALHYDNTGDEVAVVRAGEDQYGIWVAGAVVPEATPKKVAKLRRSPLSGDWRREKGNLELTAALAVNAPAFPVYAMEDDERLALVAAGSVWMSDEEPEVDESWSPPTGIIASMAQVVSDDLDRQERQQRLNDLLEDEDIYAERRRRLRAAQFAADTAVAPAPVAPAATEAPAQQVQQDQAAGSQDWAAVALAQQASTRYSIVEEGDEAEEVPTADREPVAAPAKAAPKVAVANTTGTEQTAPAGKE